jgi:hypothetical protein
VTVKLSSPAVLVVREYLLPGWRAAVDGRETRLYYADGIGRAVFLEPGRHDVEFWFSPWELRAGLWLSAAGWITTAVLSTRVWLIYGKRPVEG